jgi:hypothetical protein
MSNDDLISRVRAVLEAYASKGQLVYFSDIEKIVGEMIHRWDKVLDPIYEDLRAHDKPDLTAIVVYKDGERKGYPPWFSDGGEARSKRFNPNNLRQVGRWQKEVARLFNLATKREIARGHGESQVSGPLACRQDAGRLCRSRR